MRRTHRPIGILALLFVLPLHAGARADEKQGWSTRPDPDDPSGAICRLRYDGEDLPAVLEEVVTPLGPFALVDEHREGPPRWEAVLGDAAPADAEDATPFQAADRERGWYRADLRERRPGTPPHWCWLVVPGVWVDPTRAATLLAAGFPRASKPEAAASGPGIVLVDAGGREHRLGRGTQLAPGDRLRTPPEHGLEFRLASPRVLVRLDADTTAVIKPPREGTGPRAALALERGRMWCGVAQGGRNLGVRTPALLVLATEDDARFTLRHTDAKGTALRVLAGSVAVARGKDEPLQVRAGQLARARRGGVPAATDANPTDTDWWQAYDAPGTLVDDFESLDGERWKPWWFLGGRPSSMWTERGYLVFDDPGGGPWNPVGLTSREPLKVPFDETLVLELRKPATLPRPGTETYGAFITPSCLDGHGAWPWSAARGPALRFTQGATTLCWLPSHAVLARVDPEATRAGARMLVRAASAGQRARVILTDLEGKELARAELDPSQRFLPSSRVYVTVGAHGVPQGHPAHGFFDSVWAGTRRALEAREPLPRNERKPPTARWSQPFDERFTVLDEHVWDTWAMVGGRRALVRAAGTQLRIHGLAKQGWNQTGLLTRTRRVAVPFDDDLVIEVRTNPTALNAHSRLAVALLPDRSCLSGLSGGKRTFPYEQTRRPTLFFTPKSASVGTRPDETLIRFTDLKRITAGVRLVLRYRPESKRHIVELQDDSGAVLGKAEVGGLPHLPGTRWHLGVWGYGMPGGSAFDVSVDELRAGPAAFFARSPTVPETPTRRSLTAASRAFEDAFATLDENLWARWAGSRTSMRAEDGGLTLDLSGHGSARTVGLVTRRPVVTMPERGHVVLAVESRIDADAQLRIGLVPDPDVLPADRGGLGVHAWRHVPRAYLVLSEDRAEVSLDPAEGSRLETPREGAARSAVRLVLHLESEDTLRIALQDGQGRPLATTTVPRGHLLPGSRWYLNLHAVGTASVSLQRVAVHAGRAAAPDLPAPSLPEPDKPALDEPAAAAPAPDGPAPDQPAPPDEPSKPTPDGAKQQAGMPFERQGYALMQDFPNATVREREKHGMAVTSVAWRLGKWAVVQSSDAGLGRQWSFGRQSLDGDFLKTQWAEGRALTHLAHSGRTWLTVFSEGTGWERQRVHAPALFPAKLIQSEWQKGRRITNLAYGGLRWVLVTSTGTGWGPQDWVRRMEFPKDHVDRRWREGYRITHVTRDLANWVVVMTKGTGWGPQRWMIRSQLPEKEIGKLWDEGWRITSLASDGVNWLLVFTHFAKEGG